MQIVRLNCAFSRNLGRGDDVDGLGAIMRGILKFLSQLSAKDMDREFLIAIEKEFLDTDWYRYELAHLSSAAEEWCKENHIRYTN